MTRAISMGLIWLWIAVACVPLAKSESETNLTENSEAMRVWHTGQGLPSDNVTAILQTHDGFLWIGTSSRLARFDGVKFTELREPDSWTNSMTGITALCEDSTGHLWIGTQQNGLFRLASGKLEHFGKEDGLPGENLTSLAADANGHVWIGGSAGLGRWDGRKFDAFTTRDGLADEFVSGVNVARSGTVWITTRRGMCQFVGGRIAPYAFQTESEGRSPEYLGAYEDRRGNLWAFGDTYLINLAEGKRFNYFRGSEPTSVRIWSLCESADGRLWIGVSGRGLVCFEQNHFQPVIPGESRWPYDVRAICEDREGNLWLGTYGGGLAQLRLQSVHAWRGGPGIHDALPTALAAGTDGTIYAGFERGGIWAGTSGRLTPFGGNEGFDLQGFVTSIGIARDGTIWAATLGEGLWGLQGERSICFTSADGLASDNILAMCLDAKGNVWASTSAGTLHRIAGGRVETLGPGQGLRDATVTAMIPAAASGLWLGTEDGRVLREENGSIRTLGSSRDPGHHLVLAMYEEQPDRLWTGTRGGGLACYRGTNETRWSEADGLPGDTVTGIIEDDARNLWLATGSGIYLVARSDVEKALEHPRSPLICQFVTAAGTSANNALFGGTRAVHTADGLIAFATSTGILSVDARLSRSENSPFPVYIESASLNGEKPLFLLRGGLWGPGIASRAPFQAPVNLRQFEAHFTALSFAAPDEIQFRHKLEGYDPDWVDDSNARSARYARLTAGTYRFRAAARDGGGPWREAAEAFVFAVPAPVYSQTWAVCLYVILAVGLVAGTVRVISHRRLRHQLARLEQLQSLERERMRIARDMHDEMGSKLTKISFLSEHIQMEAGAGPPLKEKIESIAQTSRDLLKTMDEIVWVVNPRNDTLDNLTAYLSHYAVEYFQNTSIECELELPQEIPHCPLSSEARHNLFLTFEEALNNVLKHSGAAKARVTIAIRNLVFELTISDNGRGFNVGSATAPTKGERTGNGLKNMRQRLAAIGGECLLSSRPGQGARVIIRIGLPRRPAAAR